MITKILTILILLTITYFFADRIIIHFQLKIKRKQIMFLVLLAYLLLDFILEWI